MVPLASTSVYPVHVSARLDQPSRGLWLIKWLLAVPHYVVLCFLWIGFVVTSVVAFFAILFTGRYPRALFDYNVGVLRWSWRVAYYAYGALGTDRYPPFTLEEVPDYPAHLSVDYPEHLSRGLVLVKWWLLALPHYVIVGLFVGGGSWLTARSGEDWRSSWGAGGLVGVLVCIAAIILLFTGSYPKALFEVVLGLQRWALRVAGYATLMTDAYPPFRLDLGGDDPSVMALVAGPEAGAPPSEVLAPNAAAGPVAPGRPGGWTTGRVISLILGALIAFTATGLLTGGVALTVADRVARDSAGYLTTPTVALSSGSHAVVSDRLLIEAGGPAWLLPSRVLGTARVRVTADDPAQSVFVGVAPASQVRAYLAGVRYDTVSSVGDRGVQWTTHPGGAPATPPTGQSFWTASVSGPGQQVLSWEPTSGEWMLVVMRTDGAGGVDVRADVAATVPAMTWLGVTLLVLAVVGFGVATVLITLSVRTAGGRTRPEPVAALQG
jgi:hypothetical protein